MLQQFSPKTSYTTSLILLFLQILSSLEAPPTLPIQPLLSVARGIENSTPFCFTPESHPGIRTTNTADCHRALRYLISAPHFRTRFRFSKNPRNGVQVPKGWQHGECVIYVSCASAHDSDYFTLADVSTEAVRIIKECVDEPTVKYGGVHGVGDAGTFYVAVGYSDALHLSNSSVAGLIQASQLLNVTQLDDSFEGLDNSSALLYANS